MNEKLLLDYLREKNLLKSESPKLVGIENISEYIFVFEFSTDSRKILYEKNIE